MTDKISNLKAQMNEGWLKSTKFKVDFTGACAKLTTNPKFANVIQLINDETFSCSLPSSNFATYSWVEKGVPLDIPYQKTFSDFTTSHRVDSKFLTRDFFNTWQSLIMDKNTSHFGFMDDYANGHIDIQQFSDDGKMSNYWRIDRIWPVVVGAIQLSYDSNDTIAIFEVTYKFNIMQLIVQQ